MELFKGKSDGRPAFDNKLAAKLPGKHVLIGKTFQQADGTIVRRTQAHGVVTQATEKGIVVRLNGSNEIEWLPPDLRGWRPAKPGSYRLKSTDEVVKNPDYISDWIVDA